MSVVNPKYSPSKMFLNEISEFPSSFYSRSFTWQSISHSNLYPRIHTYQNMISISIAASAFECSFSYSAFTKAKNVSICLLLLFFSFSSKQMKTLNVGIDTHSDSVAITAMVDGGEECWEVKLFATPFQPRAFI